MRFLLFLLSISLPLAAGEAAPPRELPLAKPEDVGSIAFGKEVRLGMGFGLGFCVRTEDTAWDRHARVGEFGWGGMASTHYWVSPRDQLVVVTMEQTLPYNWSLERTLKPIIYDAIVK